MLYHHTPGYNAVYFDALRKLAEPLPAHAKEIALESVAERKNRKLDEGRALEIVANAWINKQLLEFYYKKPGGSGTERRNELEVYFLEVSRDNLGLYVIGYERGYHKAVRTFKLNRLLRPRLLGEPNAYQIDPKFDPKAFLSNAWGVIGPSGGGLVEVRLRFDKDAAYRLDEGGYPGGLKIVQYNRDKSVEVVVKVGTDNEGFPREVFPWIQSWGKRVTVLSPESLKKRWLEEAEHIHRHFSGAS
jgi:predicted DNA-binding transcriptional regulator YafY